jgi:alcohol dehydrogenase class IV
MMAGLPPFVSPLPAVLVFGSGKIREIGRVTAALGKRALVVIGGASLEGAGHLATIEESIGDAGVECRIFAGVPAEPTVDWVDRGREALAEQDGDVVLGIGGGSVIDVAKAVAALAREDEPTIAYHRGEATVTRRGLPMVAAPTTSGTGAEVTPNSVLTDPELHVKASLRGGDLMPTAAIVDPQLTVSCPPEQTAQSGLDAIVQALETYVSRAASPYSDALALRALELMAPALAAAVRDGRDLEARERMALGSTMGGMALACARLGLVHGLAHPIGHFWALPHGEVCGLLMPAVMEFNLPVAAAKYATAARAIGAASEAEGDDDAARKLVAWFRELAKEVGLRRPAVFDEKRLTAEEHSLIVEQTLASGSTKHNPRAATAEDVWTIVAAMG